MCLLTNNGKVLSLNGSTTPPRQTKVPLLFNKFKYTYTSWGTEIVSKIKSNDLAC